VMQLPRGSFRDLKKGIALESLIRGLKEISFSGYCKTVSGESSALLVLKGGEIILAKSGNLEGDAALLAIIRLGDSLVDAVLHDLNGTQLQLAVEFNPSARVRGETNQSPWAGRSGNERPRAPPGPAEQRPIRRHAADSPDHGPAPAPLSTEKSWHQVSEKKNDDESALLMKELDALDAMDIESMAQKFRENCRQMIEKLELEHLLEHDIRKGRT
jgi:hypothetical protein